MTQEQYEKGFELRLMENRLDETYRKLIEDTPLNTLEDPYRNQIVNSFIEIKADIKKRVEEL